MKRRDFLKITSYSILATTNLFASSDLYITTTELNALRSIIKRLRRLRRFIGYGHFNLISFKDALYYARNYSSIGNFTKEELNLIDKLFYESPIKYGFYGKRTIYNINNKISKKYVKKIPRTGHYLFKGTPLSDYNRLCGDIGKNIILTSGVRNVVKQLDLYCNKIYSCKGNMTKASKYIAPPAYSYHTVSDFDVGRRDWGYKNFTSEFAKTIEFNKIKKLNYISMRYTINNKDGVRFEPWHVKVI